MPFGFFLPNFTMTLLRTLKWIATVALTLIALAIIFVALFGWNWLRSPAERIALEKTGRVLSIKGDLDVQMGWPMPRIQAHRVSFANPTWATQQQMLTADVVAFSIHLPQLISQNLVVSDLHMVRPVVFLEIGSQGRKTWLLDRNQQDNNALVHIDRLTLDRGTLGFDDPASKTSILVDIASLKRLPDSMSEHGVGFHALGQYKGLPLTAQGSGNPVLALRDELTPYALKVEATVGQTHIQAAGSVTSLLKFPAIDMQLALSGKNLDELFILTGIAMPATRDYVTQGHLVRKADTLRYEQFSGRVGTSDVSGWLQVKTGGKRPALSGDLLSHKLSLDDLGPVIGARPDHLQAARKAVALTGSELAITPSIKRVIPDLPFKFEQWDSVDAEVNFIATSIRQVSVMPLKALAAHLSLKDAVLTLDPLQFGLAGGQINAVISLDGRHNPIQAKAKVQIKRLVLTKLMPTNSQGKTSTSLVGGEISLVGSGNSVGRMLASSNGSVAMLVSGGEISQMMMEKAGLHLWEIFRLTLTGDKQIKLRCAIANFDVKAGNMHAGTVVLDTQVTTLLGSGNIDLAQEKLNLTFTQKTKNTSLLALRSPIHIGGNFIKPMIQIDQGRVAMRALGALALGAINPLLMLIPLIDAGPGQDSDCAPWLRGSK
jgi:AsmA protein